MAVSVVGMGHVGGMEKIFNSLTDPLQTLKELDKLVSLTEFVISL